MEPTLNEGDVVVVHTWKKPKKNHVVMARVNDREVVKRVIVINEEYCLLVGDNDPLSTDSRHFGPVPHSDVLGVVFAD